MILRQCLTCGTVVAQLKKGRCVRCYRPNYGADHQQRRVALALSLPADCAYGCGKTMTSDSDWVAAHVVDGDPSSARVVSCRSCNERAKAGRVEISERFQTVQDLRPLSPSLGVSEFGKFRDSCSDHPRQGR